MHRGCRYFRLPATRPEFWANKLEGNAQRDNRNIAALNSAGWRVLVIWECTVRDMDNKLLLENMESFIKAQHAPAMFAEVDSLEKKMNSDEGTSQ